MSNMRGGYDCMYCGKPITNEEICCYRCKQIIANPKILESELLKDPQAINDKQDTK